MGYTLDESPTGARDTANELGLTEMAKEGLGYGWQQEFVRSALGRNFDYGGMMERGGNNLMSQGLLHSGAMDATLPAEVAGVGQQVASDAFNQAVGMSDTVAQGAKNTMFQLSMHEDRMNMERDIAQAQLEAQEMNWWDYVIGGASVASNLVGAGQGLGVIG